MVKKNNFVFDVDVNVINHLGIGLYSSTPAALTELVANAWDADAGETRIWIDPGAQTITIEDDGHGMTVSDIKKKFLTVGYSRRQHPTEGRFSKSGNRVVMGRKGIGKLAMFALADHIEIASQSKDSEAIGLKVDVPQFRKQLENHESIPLEEFDPLPFPKGSGTRIRLSRIIPGLKTTESYLRIKLARRFSILGDINRFRVYLNEREITKDDRGFYQHVQFLWCLDDRSRIDIPTLAKNIERLPKVASNDTERIPCIRPLERRLQCGDKEFEVSGYIASAFLPKHLGAKEDSANMVSIFANGRVFVENILTEANSAKFYQSYLVGEVHADFLDDDEVDRATASREAIKKDDSRYQALISFIQTTLESIGDQWDAWRTELGLDDTEPQNATILEWIDTLNDNRDRRTAIKLMTSIKNAVVHSNEARNEEAKRVLYRGTIIGFEKLRLTKQLDKLDAVSSVLGNEFAAIFASLDQVEESAYAEITRQRLAVIKKFSDIANDPTSLEKIAQKYLFDHLWLLDPTWDRITSRAEMEKTLTAYLKKENPDDATGARLDISYRASSGRHIVVELKRPKTFLKYYDLYEQVSRYKDAVAAYYTSKEPNKPIPPLDIYLLVGNTPTGFDESKRKSLAEVSGRLITYEQLINDARNTYQQYLNVTNLVSPLEKILEKL